MRSWCGLVVSAFVVLAIGASGCTGAADPTASPSATASPSTAFGKGEYRPGALTQLCRGITTKTTGQLGMKAPKLDANADEHTCEWTDRRPPVARTLHVGYHAYVPPQTRRDYSATDEARYRFRRPQGWEALPTSPVRGLGDEAKLRRHLAPTDRGGQVWLLVRQGNVLLDVRVDVQATGAAAHGRMPTYGTLERSALSAVRELLGRLTGRPVPAPSATPKTTAGEVTEVTGVCAAVRSAARLVPGTRRTDTSHRDSPRSGGCAWEPGVDRPDLDVEVDALPPSLLDGASGTTVAEQLFANVDGTKPAEKGLGDDARIDTYAAAGTARIYTVWLVVRKGNLLVAVEYTRPHGSDKRQMRKDAIAVARDVLAGYR